MGSHGKAFVEVNVTYVGAPFAGKTCNVRYLGTHCKPHEKLKSGLDRNGVQLLQYAPGAVAHKGIDRLPVALRFNIVTVGGNDPLKEESRRAAIRVADAIVFVADSRAARAAANVNALQVLAEVLKERARDLATIPVVLQYNWRDAPSDSLVSIADLESALNAHGAPHVEAVATRGDGVFETFEAVSKLMIEKLEDAWRFVLV